MTVLLLRGPQAPGELRTRTDRLHPFADRGEVEALPGRMAARAGRWCGSCRASPASTTRAGCTCSAPAEAGLRSPPATAVDRGGAARRGAEARDERVRSSYDAVATAYADHLVDELDGLPFETWLLDRVVAHAGGGPVVEVGCGPGHVTAYLADAGADATGIDLSPEMVARPGAASPAAPTRSATCAG